MASYNNYESNKTKRKAKGFLRTAGIVLTAALLAAGIMSAVSFAKDKLAKDRNEDNLITVDENYIKTHNTNRGVEVEVKEDGTIKLSGEATSDYVVTVATVNLKAGTYTISGLENPDVNKFYLYAAYGTGGSAIAGTSNATFTLTTDQTVTIRLSWVDGMEFGKIFDTKIQPVLVSGEVAGDFYK